MTNYLLIESRDAFESPDDGGFCCRLASALSQRGDRVAVFAVQNGVLSLRAGARAPALAALMRAGVPVQADLFSLRERGIAVERLAHGVVPSELDSVIDCLADGWRVIWH
jgi:intracellular sulfur oxidation DsrE/DsrF family protein